MAVAKEVGAVIPATLHLFIDTNIFIRLFGFTDDSLTEAEKFAALISAGKIVLYVTEQLVWEYLRNSDNQIHSSLEDLEKVKYISQTPRLLSITAKRQNSSLLLKFAKRSGANC
ncbi:DUF4935 domain-containing protein [Sphingosinicellaceae bacterium]|nr:DUF4935 domain-containing protein [Sphingosinicellaceae bacterium]